MSSKQQVVIEFDHRDDNGPRLVGPFPSHSAALDHLVRLGIPDAVWSVAQLTHPDDDRRAGS